MSLWHWHPEVALGLEGLILAYLVGVGPLRRRRGWGPRPPAAQLAAFLGGTMVMAAALLGPLAELAEHVALSAHMAQHLLLTLVVPPLWLLGTPAWLLRPALRLPGVERAGRWLTRPAVAFFAGSVPLVVWHLPALYQAALLRVAVHVLEHLTLLGGGLLLWWPIAGTLPEWPRPASPARLLYLFLATIPMTIAAAPITLAGDVLYPFYESTRGAWPLDPRTDQEAAGILMWLGGTIGYLVAGTLVFFRWAGDEDAEGDPAARPRWRMASTGNR